MSVLQLIAFHKLLSKFATIVVVTSHCYNYNIFSLVNVRDSNALKNVLLRYNVMKDKNILYS